MYDLKNKNGIIFGSTGFLGSRLAIKLSKIGANLILHGKSKAKQANGRSGTQEFIEGIEWTRAKQAKRPQRDARIDKNGAIVKWKIRKRPQRGAITEGIE